MKKTKKIIIGLILLSGILTLSCNLLINPVNSYDPNIEDDPTDPGNSPGPGFAGEMPKPVAGNIVFTFWDEALPNYNINN